MPSSISSRFASSFVGAVSGLLCATAITAQTPAGSTPEEELLELEKFVVTGSEVPVLRDRTFQPVTMLTAGDMENVGAASVAELVRTMPAFIGSANTEIRANGGTGAAGVNLRGLGGTLTLIDGQRTAGFDEINLIPTIAFDRVEIVKDGAGARYGADALTGVFNYRLVSKFDGAKARIYYGNTTEEDAGTVRAGVIAGGSRGKTNIVVAGEYYKRNAIMARDREISANADMRALGGKDWRDIYADGLIYAARPGDMAWGYFVPAPGVQAAYSSADVVPYNESHYYNFREYTATIPEQENKSVFARVNHEILEDGRLEAFVRFLFAQNFFETFPSTSPFAIDGASMLASPHRPTGLALPATTSATGYLRPDPVIPRGRRYERDVYDFHAGLKGRLADGWSWAATYVYSWWYRDDTQFNAIHTTNLRAAVANGSYNPFALPTAAGVNPNNNRAYDNPAALRAATGVGRIDHDFGMRGGDVRFNGRLFALPGGNVEIGGGVDYHRAEQSSVPDAVMRSGLYTGFNTTQMSASGYTAQGAFAELVVPVLSKDMALPLARELSFSVHVRRSEKEMNGTVRDASNALVIRERTFEETTPKFGVLYQPLRDLTVRATYAEGFRTPGLSYMFAAESTYSMPLSDPLGFTPAGSINITGKGNPNLEPERSKTWNVGVVYEPQAVPGLRFETDYYNSRIEGMVADGAQLMIDINALSQGPGFVPGDASTINPQARFADRIVRDAMGNITRVYSTPLNVSSREATGLDYAITYTWPEFAGSKWVSRLAANTTLTWALSTADELPSVNWLGRFVDAAVNSISPGSIPRHRGYFTQSWSRGQWGARATVNHVSHLEDDITRTAGGHFRRIGSWTTVDTQVAYRFKKDADWLRGVELRVGATNLLDEAPPFAAGAAYDGYDMTTYSNRGRFLYVELTKSF